MLQKLYTCSTLRFQRVEISLRQSIIVLARLSWLLEDWETSAARRRGRLSNKSLSKWRLAKSWTSKIGPSISHNVLVVPRECCILTEKAVIFAKDYDATALLEDMASGVLSSFEMTLAFSERAAIAYQVVNLSCRFRDVR